VNLEIKLWFRIKTNITLKQLEWNSVEEIIFSEVSWDSADCTELKHEVGDEKSIFIQ
jgi:hypothetical protein